MPQHIIYLTEDFIPVSKDDPRMVMVKWHREDGTIVFGYPVKEEVEQNKLFIQGGPGSGDFNHKGRPGEVGGSRKEGEGDISEPRDYSLFMTYSQRWNSGSDYEARGIAYDLAYRDKELRNYLQREAFGEELSGQVTLYRVGNLSEYDITSFFTAESQAQSYQRRMGVDRIEEYIVDGKFVIPSGAGSGEVWVRNDFMW